MPNDLKNDLDTKDSINNTFISNQLSKTNNIELVKALENGFKLINLSDDEIVSGRMNKFLQIGRGGGFSSKTDTSTNLSFKKNNINLLIEEFLKKKIFYISILAAIGIIIAFIFFI